MAGESGATERTFTETEHFALLTDAVARESASLTEKVQELEGTVTTVTQEKAEEVSALQSRVDVLEAEKAAAEKAAADVQAAFDAYKAELAELAAVEARKAERAAKVKEVASDLEDTYFSDERVARWASMTEEAFEALIADLVEASASKKTPPPFEKKDEDEKKNEEARETAAFTGGDAPSAPAGSTLGQFLGGRRPSSAK